MIVIIGAGPAGLSAAYHLNTDCEILEQLAEPGGLCRSFELGGATFDIGGHAFFTRHESIRRLIEDTFEIPLFKQQRRAWVYSHGTYIRYPFQMHLRGLPVDVVRECLVGLFRAATERDETPASDLQSWIDRAHWSRRPIHTDLGLRRGPAVTTCGPIRRFRPVLGLAAKHCVSAVAIRRCTASQGRPRL